MNKHQKLAPNQVLVPKMINPPFSLEVFLKKLKRKEALIKYRQDMHEATKRLNYINEYERIAGLLSKSTTHSFMDSSRLKNRQAELKRLLDESFHP